MTAMGILIDLTTERARIQTQIKTSCGVVSQNRLHVGVGVGRGPEKETSGAVGVFSLLIWMAVNMGLHTCKNTWSCNLRFVPCTVKYVLCMSLVAQVVSDSLQPHGL